jgi:hypothetical protein
LSRLRSIASGDACIAISEAEWSELFRLASEWPGLPPMPDLVAAPSSASGPRWHLECLRRLAEGCDPIRAEVGEARRRYHACCAAFMLAPNHPGSRPLVTVLIPVYNRAGPVVEAIESCLRQTWRPLEIDVVDDGSDDDVAGAVRPFGALVRLHRKPNGGAASARNLGIRVARGEFVHFLDSDDLLLPDSIARKVEAFLRVPDAELCHSDVDFGLPPQPARSERRRDVHDLMSAVCVGHPFLIPAVMMPRWSTLDAPPFEEDLRIADDTRYWFTLGLRGTKVVALAEALTSCRKLGPSLSDLRKRTEEDSFTVLARNLCDVLASPPHWRYAAACYARLAGTATRKAPYEAVTGRAGQAIARLHAILGRLASGDRSDGYNPLPLFAALRAADIHSGEAARRHRSGDDLDGFFAAMPALIRQGLHASAPLQPCDIEAWLDEPLRRVPKRHVSEALDWLRARDRRGPGDLAAIDWILRNVALPLRQRDADRFRRLRRWTGSGRLAARLVWRSSERAQ